MTDREPLSCTALSATTGGFFDLRPLTRVEGQSNDFHVRGYDYNANFTLNICAPVLSQPNMGMYYPNISAYYERDGKNYSIGTSSDNLYFRGRKLLLEYNNGSPCPNSKTMKKSTLISFVCDREVSRASISFLGQLQDCAYVFDVRTPYACPSIDKHESLNPFAIFAIIFSIAFLVYCAGGIVYQRTVVRARGIRQIPHIQVLISFFTAVGSTMSFAMGFIMNKFKRKKNFNAMFPPEQENFLFDE